MNAIISLLTVVLPPVLKIIEAIINKNHEERVKEAYAKFMQEHKDARCKRSKR